MTKIPPLSTITPSTVEARVNSAYKEARISRVAFAALAGLSMATCLTIAGLALGTTLVFPPAALIITAVAFAVFGVLAFMERKHEQRALDQNIAFLGNQRL